MNERIQQLAEQAGLKWKAQSPHYTNTNNPIDFPVSANRDLEKFAELIVRECAKEAFKYTWNEENYQHYNDNGWDCLPGDLQSHIKEHFGVKE